VRQRRKIARGADRPLLGITDVIGASIASISAQISHRTPDAPRAERQELERHHQPHVAGVERLARRRAMRQDQVALQRAVSSGAIRIEASLPKPVLTP
jgi:hypothetical protein